MHATTAQHAERSGAVTIRPVAAADAPAMAAFLLGLDGAARRLRFHGGVNPQSQTLLRHLTTANGRQHAAWVAVVQANGAEQVVGEARYVRQGQGSAELAMTVAAAWRGCGLADRLLATLTQAACQAGVHQLVAEVLGENGRMQALLQRHGYVDAQGADHAPDGVVLRLVCALSAPRRAHAVGLAALRAVANSALRQLEGAAKLAGMLQLRRCRANTTAVDRISTPCRSCPFQTGASGASKFKPGNAGY
jgi:RimJ/RimL family protein N-acetyltransferase